MKEVFLNYDGKEIDKIRFYFHLDDDILILGDAYYERWIKEDTIYCKLIDPTVMIIKR